MSDPCVWTGNAAELCTSAVALLFSGEEQYGKYLDLYANHTTYNNLKHIGKRLGYLQYLDVLLAAQSTTVHSELPKECRTSRDYELYVAPLRRETTSAYASANQIHQSTAYILDVVHQACATVS